MRGLRAGDFVQLEPRGAPNRDRDGWWWHVDYVGPTGLDATFTGKHPNVVRRDVAFGRVIDAREPGSERRVIVPRNYRALVAADSFGGDAA